MSLTGSPLDEVRVGYDILKSLNLRQRGPVITSTKPAAVRKSIWLPGDSGGTPPGPSYLSAARSRNGLRGEQPGRSREADLGIAAGKRSRIAFKRGNVIGKFP